MKTKNLWVLIGPAGSGKTTYRRQFCRTNTVTVICPDEIRFEYLNSNETGLYFDPKKEPEIWKIVIDKFQTALDQSDQILIDATNLFLKHRLKNWVVPALKKGYTIYYKIFQADLFICLMNNAIRERVVPQKVIARQFYQLEEPEAVEYHFIETITIDPALTRRRKKTSNA